MSLKSVFCVVLSMLLTSVCASEISAAKKPAIPEQNISSSNPPLSDSQLLTEIQHRAVRFFWEQADPYTGLVNDRAGNRGKMSDYTVSSIAGTGYGLAALPIAVQHGWIPRVQAEARALTTLRFIHDHMDHNNGWYYHFVDRHTGVRVWHSEVSSIDTALLLAGALVCGQYWHGTEVQRLANSLYSRVDWMWMLTNDGDQPDKLLVSHGWDPEHGFLKYNWDNYCELMILYLLGIGAERDPLPADCWKAWNRNVVNYGGFQTLGDCPIFCHQMAQGYFNFKNQRDALGFDYWKSAIAGTLINRQFCIDHIKTRKTYAPDIWGLNACDAPDGYRAYAAPGTEDGTVSSTGALASVFLTPRESIAAAKAIYARYGDKLWGRYGFGDAFNVDRDWYDHDVIGIDLGMAMLAIEDHRTGLPWRLMASHPVAVRAWKRAGFVAAND